MLDTEAPPQNISPDTQPTYGRYPRLTDAALDHAKTKFNPRSVEDLCKRLGLANRMTLWRARRGLHNIQPGLALKVADQIGWPLAEVFEGGWVDAIAARPGPATKRNKAA